MYTFPTGTGIVSLFDIETITIENNFGIFGFETWKFNTEPQSDPVLL
jgi:hypothetical protein